MKILIAALLAATAMASAAPVDKIVVDNSAHENYRDMFLDDAGFTGSGTGASGGSSEAFFRQDLQALAVGKIDANWVRERQSALFFKLPPLPEGRTVKKATLKLCLAGKDNDNSDVAKLGPVSLFHDPAENDGRTMAPNFDGGADTERDVATSASEAGTYASTDVTAAIQADYKADGIHDAVAYFRIALDNADAYKATSTGNDRYIFAGGAAKNVPQLIIETVDE